MKKVVSFNEINLSIIRIKNIKKKFVTNFYLNQDKVKIWISNDLLFTIEIEEVVFFIKKSINFSTLFFIASSNEQLKKSLPILLSEIGDETLILDIVQKEESSDIINLFNNKSFNLYATLVRMNRLNQKFNVKNTITKEIKEANLEHISKLNNLFYSFFDAKSEQLPIKEELMILIENKNVLIYELDNKIIGFLIYEIAGFTLHLKYWFVHPDYREMKIGSKLFNFFENIGKDTNRHLLWVDKSNENAIKRYKHYGFIEEKMYNYVLTSNIIKYE